MAPTNMFLYHNRLASFRPRRRSSVASKSASAPRWPHVDLTPELLADAGFHWTPSGAELDSVTCFLCKKTLDGWEPGDDPVIEHLKHSRNCGWAVVCAATYEGSQYAKDPHSKLMGQVREMTFDATLWAHENQGVGNLTIPRMVDAGFVFAPTKDSLDYAFCPLCKIGLDGWESEDDPREEHRRRNPDCLFFTTEQRLAGRKRASRASEQLAGSEPKAKAKKKSTAKAKTTGVKRGARKKTVADTALDEAEPAEPEATKPRGRKRSSSVLRDHAEVQEDELPKRGKRRNTRASSRARSSSAPPAEDAVMTDPPRKGRSTTGRKKAGPTSSSQTRVSTDIAQLTSQSEGETGNELPTRQTRRTTRSRASILSGNEPANTSGAPTASGVFSKITSSVTKSPIKSFFREEDQDFSLPVKIPNHLQESREASPVAENALEPVEEPEPVKVPVKKGRGRKKIIVEDTLDAERPKRGKATSKRKDHAARSRSNTIESSTAVGDQAMQESAGRPSRSAPAHPKRGKKAILEEVQPAAEEPNADREVVDAEDNSAVNPVELSDSGSVICHPIRSSSPQGQTVAESVPQSSVTDDQHDVERSLGRHEGVAHYKQAPGTPPTDELETIEQPQSQATLLSTPPPLIAGSASRPAVSPARKQVQIVAQTPQKTKGPSVSSANPWQPIDIDTAFPVRQPGDVCKQGLSAEELQMTVEQWIKWNAAMAERRLTEQCERMVAILEEKADLAAAAIQGISA